MEIVEDTIALDHQTRVCTMVGHIGFFNLFDVSKPNTTAMFNWMKLRSAEVLSDDIWKPWWFLDDIYRGQNKKSVFMVWRQSRVLISKIEPRLNQAGYHGSSSFKSGCKTFIPITFYSFTVPYLPCL